MNQKEILQSTLDQVSHATNHNELLVAAKKLRKDTKKIDPINEEEMFILWLELVIENIKNNDLGSYESNKAFSKLLTRKKFLEYIKNIYLDTNNKNSKLAVEVFYCAGYLLDHNKKQAEKIFKTIAQSPDIAISYLYRADTSAMMLQILLSFNRHKKKHWKNEKTIKEIIKYLLFSGNSSVTEIIAALSPIQIDTIDYNIKFLVYLLQLIGFSKKKAIEIVDTWSNAYDLVDTFSKSIIPNVVSLILLEAEKEGTAILLNKIYGIKTFARYNIEQYLDQLETMKNPSKPFVLNIAVDDDFSGSLLGLSNKLWTPTSKQLNENGIDFIVAEVGQSIEKIVKQIELISQIHGKAEQIIFSIHASKEGFTLFYQFAEPEYIDGESELEIDKNSIEWVSLSKKEIKNQLVPALKKALKKDGTVIFNICMAPEFRECLSGLNCILPNNERNAIIALSNGSPDVPLLPTYVEWTKEEYIQIIREHVADILGIS